MLTTSPLWRVPDRVFRGHVLPRVLALLLEAEGDALALLVHAEDHHFDFLVNRHDLRGMADPAPGHVGDVEQAVNAAQVHERAEVGDVLDRALAGLADLDLGHDLGLHLLALFLDQLAAADDDVAALLVNLEDLAGDFLADVLGDVARPADVDLRGRQEHRHADVHEQPALDLAHDAAGDHVAFLVVGDDLFPAADAVGLALREHDDAGVVLHGVEEHLDLIARLDRSRRP